LRTKDILQSIKKRDEIMSILNDKFNSNTFLSITTSKNGDIKYKFDENDSIEIIEKVLEKVNSQKQQSKFLKSNLDFETLFKKFKDYKKRIEKKSNNYIIDINGSLKYLKFFIDNYEVKDLIEINSQFFNELQRDFFYIPKRFFQSKYKDFSLLRLKQIHLTEEQKLNDKTINKHFINFGEFMKYLERENFIENNPIKVKLIKVNKNITRKKEFDNDDLKTIFNSDINSVYMDYFKVLLYTGMRNGELTKLTVKNIDFDNELIDIVDSKTQSGIRQIPINISILDLLKIHCKNKNKDDFVFFRGNSDQNQKKGNRLIRKFITDKNKSLHSFRKNFTQKLYKITENENYIKHLIGHSQNQNITYTTYNRQKIDIEKLRYIVQEVDFQLLKFDFENEVDIL